MHVLLNACEHDRDDEDLERVRNVIERQLAWIAGVRPALRPSVQRALDFD